MSKRLEVKDLINIGLFSVLGFIFMMIGSFLAMVPVLMPVVPFAQGVLVGPVNLFTICDALFALFFTHC